MHIDFRQSPNLASLIQDDIDYDENARLTEYDTRRDPTLVDHDDSVLEWDETEVNQTDGDTLTTSEIDEDKVSSDLFWVCQVSKVRSSVRFSVALQRVPKRIARIGLLSIGVIQDDEDDTSTQQVNITILGKENKSVEKKDTTYD